MEQPFISLSGKAISIIIISQRKGVRGYEMSFSGVLGRKSFNKYHENVSRNKRMFPGASPLLPPSWARDCDVGRNTFTCLIVVPAATRRGPQ